MHKKRLAVNWHEHDKPVDFEHEMKRYKQYLEHQGLRESTIIDYVARVSRYLRHIGKADPSNDDLMKYYGNMVERKLSRSSINNNVFAIKKYYGMREISITRLPFITPHNHIPYYFNEEDISKIFSVCHNLKHYAMLLTLFYAGLRATELCSLDLEDLDLKALTIRVRDGKGGKEAICFINNETAQALRDYLAARPDVVVNGQSPLFITDFGGRWDRRGLWSMFNHYKKLAGIEKHGGLHVFGRHSLGSLLVKNGCDIITVKELMRHSDVHTTMRYLHLSDSTKRAKYDKFLQL